MYGMDIGRIPNNGKKYCIIGWGKYKYAIK